jgi:primosomal protein N' (replication factor Y)
MHRPYTCGPLSRFADIIIPLAVPGLFTYELPETIAALAKPGMRTVVPMGKGRTLYTGVIRRLHNEPPPGLVPRHAVELLDGEPVVTETQLVFWEAIAAHYMCTPGEVLVAALPGSLLLSSSTKVMAAAGPRPAWSGDTRKEMLLDALEARHELTLKEAGEVLGLKDPMRIVKRYLEEGVLTTAEEMGKGYKPRMDRYVALTAAFSTEEAMHALFDQLERAPKQLHLLMRYIELSRFFSDDPRPVRREQLLRSSDAVPADLKRLVDKGVFAVEERPAGDPPDQFGKPKHSTLSPAQAATLQQVRDGFDAKSTVLLQGVTASGKTELYMQLIEEAVERGEQVLYLLPEIALTTQIIGRLRARFGDRVAVSHSRLSQRERAELWMQMLREPDRRPVIVGARSALFLPFTKLGLVVVDEEHDPSYKQHDPAPRYHARDMAQVLAGLHGAKTLLGSATPSMESLFNAKHGKYGFARLDVRHGDAVLPTIIRVDLNEAQKRKQMRGHFSKELLAGIEQALARKEQVIIFQNRRGYVPAWQCESCGWVPECEHCDVSLTYHKHDHGLRCHYCGRRYTPPVKCPACASNRLRMVGLGTEKVEEELALVLPEARGARMDQDTTRGKHAFERLLQRFGDGAIDILVGTQMVTKGLDFEQVTVIGIINADNLMRFPDLRAHERAFQLMAQVAGRSGRKKDPGQVYIQARDIHHPLIGLVAAHDVDGMYARELPLREAHGYPPYSRMVRLLLKHKDVARVDAAAHALAQDLRTRLGDRVLGPEPPTVARVRDKHLRAILLKLDRRRYQTEKAFLREVIDQLFADPKHRPVQLVVDVDPL